MEHERGKDYSVPEQSGVFPEMTVCAGLQKNGLNYTNQKDRTFHEQRNSKSKATDNGVEGLCLEKSKKNFCLEKMQAVCNDGCWQVG